MDFLNDLRKQFASPGSQYRSAPFWSWNDDLEPEELSRQIRDMQQQGMGGFFMHSREGLETEYMSDRWMQCVDACVRAAEETDTYAWIYDEDRWPSGGAGGLVPRLGDAYRSKGITAELTTGTYVWEEDTLAVFAVMREQKRMQACTVMPKAEAIPCPADRELLVLRLEVSAPSEWFNNDAPSDNLNPQCVKAFLDITYQAYADRFAAHFGKRIPGIFTDEPNISHRYCKFTGRRGFIPWTYGFGDRFQKEHGYDIIPMLPHIFLDGDSSRMIRHDYWKSISALFVEAYTQQIGAWCQDHNVQLTGHFLFENELGSSVKVGGSVMPHYLYQHVPGIDLLDEQTDEDVTVRQCTSVANQFGKRRVLSEMYAATGWEFDFEGQKWLGDWQYVQGINLRCQHVGYYSIRGCRKRDFPPAFNYNTSWWKYNHIVEDYYARLSMILSQGQILRNVLVLHPLSTAWSMMGSDMENEGMWQWDSYALQVNAYGDRFNALLRLLMGEHFDYDLGDEVILRDHATVAQGSICVGQCTYQTVVVPQIDTMFASTARLLEQFLAQGGHVVIRTPLPAMLDGREDASLTRILSHPNVLTADSDKTLLQALEQVASRSIRVLDSQGFEARNIFSMVRRTEDGKIVFLVNHDRHTGCDIRLVLDQTTAELWDPLTGKQTGICARDGVFHLSMAPNDAKLLIVPDAPVTVPVSAQPKQEKLLCSLGPVSSFVRTQPNTLILDKCSWRFDDTDWSETTDVWQAQRAVREKLDMPQVYYNGLPQRYKWIRTPHPMNGTPVWFRFVFDVRKTPKAPVYLVLERSGEYEVTLNGMPVDSRICGHLVDRTLHMLRLPQVQAGENELLLRCAYRLDREMEDIYLAGDFGVDLQHRLTEEPESLHFGDWCLQGYPHYCGSMVYRFTLPYHRQKQVTLRLGDYSAVHVEVRVNGKTAGQIPWRAANGICLDEYLIVGDNTVELEVMGSARNLFGPFHQAQGKVMRTDWRAFRTEGKDYTPDYILKPYGLYGQIHITCEQEA